MSLMSFVFRNTDTVDTVFEQLNDKSLPERLAKRLVELLVEYLALVKNVPERVSMIDASDDEDNWEILSTIEAYGSEVDDNTGIQMGRI